MMFASWRSVSPSPPAPPPPLHVRALHFAILPYSAEDVLSPKRSWEGSERRDVLQYQQHRWERISSFGLRLRGYRSCLSQSYAIPYNYIQLPFSCRVQCSVHCHHVAPRAHTSVARSGPFWDAFRRSVQASVGDIAVSGSSC